MSQGPCFTPMLEAEIAIIGTRAADVPGFEAEQKLHKWAPPFGTWSVDDLRMKHGHFQVLFMQIYGHRLDPTAETQDNERIREMLPLEATHVSENQRHKTRIPGCLKIPGVASSAAAFWAFCAWRMAAMMKMVASLDPWTCWSHRCHSDYHWIPEKPAEACWSHSDCHQGL